MPQDINAEKGILCSILLSPKTVLPECVEKITEDYFWQPAHQIIYKEMVELQNTSKPIDFISLTGSLKDKGELDKAGGAAAILELFTFVPTASNADYYIDIVREKYLLRQLILTCTDLVGRAYDEQGDVKHLLDEAEAKVMSIGEDRLSGEVFSSKECLVDALNRYDEAKKSGGAIQGLLTGIPRLDEKLRGLRGGQMIVIAAKQKHGKSALGFQIANYLTMEPQNLSVGAVSLEMSRREITDRRVAQQGRVDLGVLDSGTFTQHDITKIHRSVAQLQKGNLYIKDQSGLSILQIRAILRRMKSQYGIHAAIIDYLQIISPVNRKDSRERQIAEISLNIKQCAQELDIPIIVCCQINKSGDLRESTAIEMDCDKLIIIENEEGMEDEDWEQEAKPRMSLRIKYNRGGPCGRIPVWFDKKYTLFEQVSPEAF